MNRATAWILIAAGILLEAVAIVSPLTPYPVMQLFFEREYLEIKKGYEEFLARGSWQQGDRGFELAKLSYMRDVAKGHRPRIDPPSAMLGLTLDRFQLEDTKEFDGRPEARRVFVIYSNQQGHVMRGMDIKGIIIGSRSQYTVLVSAALVLAGVVLTCIGLRRVLPAPTTALTSPNTATSAA
jgi:hypothetical protein